MNHDILHTVIEGALVSLYLFVLFIIVTSKSKVLRTPFYVMFVATGFADVFSIFASCFNRLNRQLGLGTEFKQITGIAVVVSGVTFLAHLIGNMLLTFNRYSALCFMEMYDKIWTLRNVRIMILLQYVVAFAGFSHNIGVEILYAKNDGIYTFAGIDPNAGWRNRCVYLLGSFFYAAISATFNTKVLIEWRRLLKISDNTSISRHEKGLLLYTVLVFVSTMLLCLQQILRAIAILTGNASLDLWAIMQFYWINDVRVCVPPFCLLLLSANLRQDIANFLRNRRNQNISTASVSLFNNRQSTMGKY